MPARDGLRPLKAWRYVGVYGPEVMLCAAVARIGPARQSFWAVWDREELHEQTHFRGDGVALPPGRLIVPGSIDVTLEEQAASRPSAPPATATRGRGSRGASQRAAR
jgi:hypothetical protein